MKKEMTIFYEVHDNIYVNLTNKLSLIHIQMCIRDRLNSHGYIVPGLGDAGDRIFGTKQTLPESDGERHLEESMDLSLIHIQMCIRDSDKPGTAAAHTTLSCNLYSGMHCFLSGF